MIVSVILTKEDKRGGERGEKWETIVGYWVITL